MRSIDLQVNGYLAHDYSSTDINQEQMAVSAQAMLAQGCSAFLPTIITSAAATYQRNLPMLAALCRDPVYVGALPGIHVEGPFLCPEPGAIGAHNPEWIRDDPDFLLRMQDWADGAIILLTIAADHPRAVDICQRAHRLNITVSLGHHHADADALRACADAGATALTHLGNGVAGTLPRHHNPIWAGLAEDALSAMLITDGHHLPMSLVQTMIRAKGIDKTILVSDASPIAGMPAGHYHTLGNAVVLQEDGRLYNPEKGCLVGSSAHMNTCIACMRDARIVSDAELQRMVWDNPLDLLGLRTDFL